MNRFILNTLGTVLMVVLLPVVISGCTRDAQLRAKGTALFDGQTLAGWNQVGAARWRAIEGELAALKNSGDGMLVTEERFEDFKLTLEFWVDEQVNSGIFIRCQSAQDISPLSCYEINIWDKHPKQEFRTGSIVMKVSPPLARVDTVGKWNRYEITAVGKHIHVVLNGETTAELIDETHTRGFIALQRANAGQVRFRSLVFEPL